MFEIGIMEIRDKCYKFLLQYIVSPTEVEHSYFSTDFRLKILLWIFLNHSV